MPQMGEIVRTRQLIADVEGNFPELALEVGRRLRVGDVAASSGRATTAMGACIGASPSVSSRAARSCASPTIGANRPRPRSGERG